MSTVFRRFRLYGELVMFSHSLFSLSFALAAALVASYGRPSLRELFWVTMAFLGGRTAANALNRVIDREIDATNPRTAGRHLPSGRLSTIEALGLAGLSFCLLALAAFMLRPLCLLFLPLGAALFLLYSYTKRFTWLCHAVLGITCAGAPTGAWLAMTGRVDLSWFVLSAANGLWVAGFDVIYATQDEEHDRTVGLHSIPAAFGTFAALGAARLLHLGAVGLLAALGLLEGLGPAYYGGILAVAALLAYEHSIVRPWHLAQVRLASYSVNQLVSLAFFLGLGLDYLLTHRIPLPGLPW